MTKFPPALTLNSRVTHPTAPREAVTDLVAMASIKAREAAEGEALPRQPIDLVVVLDKSGSMTGDKLELCKKTLVFLVTRALTSIDSLALVLFDTHVSVCFPLTLMNPQGKETCIQRINAVRSGSSTNLSGGLLTGLDLLVESGKAPVASVVLLTDGQWNAGIMDCNVLRRIVAKKIDEFDPKKQGKPTVFTFGYGSDADAKVLSSLAEPTGGTFYSILDVDAVPLAFSDVVGGLISVAAQSLVLSCEVQGAGAELIGEPLASYPSERISSSKYVVRLKDCYRGESREIPVKLRIPKTPTGPGNVSITFSLSYLDVSLETTMTLASTMVIERHDGDRNPEGLGDLEVNRHVLRWETAKALKEATSLADAGDLKNARAKVELQAKAVTLTMTSLGADCDEDDMVAEQLWDLNIATEALQSGAAYEGGRSDMFSGFMAHGNQRANKSSKRTRAPPSSYATSAKRSMLEMAKSAF